MFGGPGVIFVKIAETNSQMSNIFLWLMLSVGMGLLLVLYSREWFARYGSHPVKYPVRVPSTKLDVDWVLRCLNRACMCVLWQDMDEGWMIFVPRSFLAFYSSCTK